MNDLERYLFDLQGFLVVEDVLAADEVVRLNGAIDRHTDSILYGPMRELQSE